MTDLQRRTLLRQGGLAASLAVLPLSLANWGCRNATGPAPVKAAGYAGLQPVADETTGAELLLLPEGFRYLSHAWAGDRLSDDNLCPDRHDGMGVVAEQNGVLTLVRNHERSQPADPYVTPIPMFDDTSGGTTTLQFDARNGRWGDSWISLAGTLINCAGGVTPWGTWLSCEEAVYSPDLIDLPGYSLWDDWSRLRHAKRDHGWVFEVPASGIAEPVPIREMGQFFHEAAAVDVRDGAVYMTEDRTPAAGFYRFLPRVPGELHQCGVLQMLALNDPDAQPLRHGRLGEWMDCHWVDIPLPTQGHSPGTHDGGGVVGQGIAAGGFPFIALEGCCINQGQVLFTSKLGGQAGVGQVYAYDPATDRLMLAFESASREVINGPDNIVAAPDESLLICEDPVEETGIAARLMMLAPDGGYRYLAQANPAIEGLVKGFDIREQFARSEWAGVCLSPDGQWLFANLQHPGITVAITGPWPWLTA